ncbi:FecR domain-containing protein [Butyricimonas hominis]|uniref:FecR family protein n=1 Tax=Butyricimonas TaxID=574697 RepID=UPI003519B739
MKEENTVHIENILCRFLTKGEAVRWDELRKELGKDEYAHVKKELLRLRETRLEANHERIWEKIQDDLRQKTRKRKILRFARYAAVLMLPLALGILFLLYREDGQMPKLVAENTIADTTGLHGAYLVLDGGTKVELSKPHVDTIRREDGIALAVDTLGTLMYNTVKAENPKLSYHTIIVPRGGEYTLVLNDGSRVRLNADSELRFPIEFASGERKVFLKGEGYFEVQRDTTRPFRVDVHGDAMIEVLGTEFNINAYPENGQIFTTLVEGSVKVAGMMSDTAVVLQPRQQAALSGGNIRVREVNPEDYITWINGRFYFERMPLEEILLQLERWYDLQVFWASEELKSYEFTGAVWRDNSIRQTLDMIEKTTDVCFTVSGRTVTVTASL